MWITEATVAYLTYIHPLVSVCWSLFIHERRSQQQRLVASSSPPVSPRNSGSRPRSSGTVESVATGANTDELPPPFSDWTAVEISNMAVVLVISWLLELLDYSLISHVFAMRELWLFGRIALGIWLQHPTWKGGAVLYCRVLKPLLDQAVPVIDAIVADHGKQVEEQGFIGYVKNNAPGRVGQAIASAEPALGAAANASPLATPRPGMTAGQDPYRTHH